MVEKRDEVLALIQCIDRLVSDALELGRVTDRRPPFKYSALTRVWFSDTDAQGVVYYGRYLPYFDHARTEYHRHLGVPRRSTGAEFVMRASHGRVPRAGPLRRPDRGLRPGRAGSAARASPTSAPPIACPTRR